MDRDVISDELLTDTDIDKVEPKHIRFDSIHTYDRNLQIFYRPTSAKPKSKVSMPYNLNSMSLN